MPNSIAIKVNHLTKIYKLYDKPIDRLKESLHPFKKQYHKEFYALNDINFEIKKGETVGIIGKNGAGKSTLLKIITGVLTPTSGSVHVNGRIASLLELGAGFNPEYTGVENIYFQGSLMGYTREEMEAKVSDILAFADIGDFVYQPVKMYSSGMFARLAFAVAINVDPDILIVDEALSVGDIAFQVKCFQKFRQFKEKGKTILFVTHSTSQITQLCSVAFWFVAGAIHKSGEARAIAEEYHAFMTHNVFTKKNDDEIKIVQLNNLAYNLVEVSKNIDWNGEGGMRVLRIGLFDEEKKLVSVIKSSKKLKFVYEVQALTYIFNPLVSFMLIDRNGNRLFGSSNITEELQFEPISDGQLVLISFDFTMPELANDDYLFSIGIGDGSQEAHIRHQYITDAYKIHFNSSSSKQKQATLLKLAQCQISIQGQ